MRQNVAEAVVRTRSSLSSWSCMGARRRNVGPLPSPKEDDLPEASLISSEVIISESLVTHEVGTRVVSVVSKAECGSSSSSDDGSGNDEDTDEEAPLLPGDGEVVTTSAPEDITEGELWFELEKELQRQEDEPDAQAREEEAAAAREITEEENMLTDAAESSKTLESSASASDVSESLHFYPPGRIMHIISMPPSDVSSDSVQQHENGEERVAIYETPRNLYSKLRLSRTMIKDHFMPMYKRMMELLIRELENEEACTYVV